MADTYDSLNALKYLNAVVNETIRLYQGSKMERIPSVDYVLKGTGITIKKGHVVQIPTFAMHRDPANFADPDTFRPERFLPENIAHNPYTYLPFGVGPRNCIGMYMVKWMVKLALVSLVQRYVFYPTEKPVEFYVVNGGLMPKSVFLKIGKRVWVQHLLWDGLDHCLCRTFRHKPI
ncbi:unnamed protein product [Oppiella nova]|uniref:Cytochrome P450 n=1 Tax=Oppiella nova TaxID=334625 RepID=A0A7R9QZA3_9ACAR|nr:unnamed protein product [Oppiella nova]CAG2179958.1 unnamed protein product [Oppiella nova]